MSFALPAFSAAAAASAASMPVFMALWLPLMRGRFTKPAAQPISAPPGKASCGTDCAAAFGDGAGAIADALAAFQHLGDGRMGLGALEFAERVQPGIPVIEMHDKTDGQQRFSPQ